MLTKPFLLLFLLINFFLLSACSFFSPHRIDIQQGNILEQDKVNQIQRGMRKDQVQFILGTPMLLDPFHKDRWDYVHTIRHGHDPLKKQRLTLHFEDDELISIVGNILPGVEIIDEINHDDIITVPLAEYVDTDDTPWYSWFVWWDDDKQNAVEKPKPEEPEPNQVNPSARIPEILEENKRN